MRTCRSGLPPATQAAVACVNAAEHPDVTRPHSAPVSTARRAPIDSASSSRCTYWRAAASIAARTSGSINEPPMIVKVPRALTSGLTPTARYTSAAVRVASCPASAETTSGDSAPASVDKLSSVARSRPPRRTSLRLNGCALTLSSRAGKLYRSTAGPDDSSTQTPRRRGKSQTRSHGQPSTSLACISPRVLRGSVPPRRDRKSQTTGGAEALVNRRAPSSDSITQRP